MSIRITELLKNAAGTAVAIRMNEDPKAADIMTLTARMNQYAVAAEKCFPKASVGDTWSLEDAYNALLRMPDVPAEEGSDVDAFIDGVSKAYRTLGADTSVVP